MPRRRPNSLRRERVRARASKTTSRIPGLSSGTVAEISRLERSRLCPGDVQAAWERWGRFVREPLRTLDRIALVGDVGEFYDGCDCCGPTDFGRRSLENAMLSAPAARDLRAQVGKLDQCLTWRARRAGAAHLLAVWWHE